MWKSNPTRLEKAGGKAIRLFTISPFGRSREDAAPYLRAIGANIPEKEKKAAGSKGFGRIVRIRDKSDSRCDWRKFLQHHPRIIAEPLPGYERFDKLTPSDRGYSPTEERFADRSSVFQVVVPASYKDDYGKSIKFTPEQADEIFARIESLWMVIECSSAINIAPPRGAAGSGQFTESSKKRAAEGRREAIAKAEDRAFCEVPTAHGGTKNNIAPAEKGRKTPRAVPNANQPSTDIGVAVRRRESAGEQEQIRSVCAQFGLDPFQEVTYIVKDAILVDVMEKDEYGREFQKRRADGTVMQKYTDKARTVKTDVQAIVAQLIRLVATDPKNPKILTLQKRLPFPV